MPVSPDDQSVGSGESNPSFNDQYRVLFKWMDGEAHKVFVGDLDYH